MVTQPVQGGVVAFADLALIADDDDARRVHRTTGLYFVKRGGVAHAGLDCGHLDETNVVQDRLWRVATDTQVRELRIAWCEGCCE